MRTIAVPLCFAATLLATMSRAQPVEVCNFTRPVRIIDTLEGLPVPIRDALVKDGVIDARPGTNSANPRVIGAGQWDDFYFVWGEYGDLGQAYNVNLYRLRAGESMPQRVKHFPQLPIDTKLCPFTDNLLQNPN